ncbi:recombination-associated protein RdgC [Pantoea agglomerans]|uniref:recombination-associated protein RdgC n=1 Tax=Enterobacter agglomerans TaxID=549 RepID=UPI0016546A4C|nr:recombination-associated protein RdgC [Pantoea agglomerans]
MKAFKVIFPYSTTNKIPDDITDRLNGHAFSELKDGQTKSSGFSLLTESERFIQSDNRHLFHYCEQTRKADKNTVRNIFSERLKKVEEEGRELTEETREELQAIAEREATKFAAIKHSGVFIVFDAPAGRVWCAGSTVNKCEAALKRLRRVLGSLDTEPVVLTFASRRLSRLLGHGSLTADEALRVPEYGKIVANDTHDSNSARMTFEGFSLLDSSVSEVLTDRVVSAVEMDLIKPDPNGGKAQVLASFVLKAPEKSGVILSGLWFAGGATDGAAEQNHASDMQIVAKTCQQIMDGLSRFMNRGDL